MRILRGFILVVVAPALAAAQVVGPPVEPVWSQDQAAMQADPRSGPAFDASIDGAAGIRSALADGGGADGGAVAAAESAPDAALEPATESLPLGAPSEAQPLGAARAGGAAGSLGIGRTVIALAAVVAMAAMLAAAYRQWASRHGGLAMAMGAGGRAPSGVLEVLGRYPISRGLTLVLLKIDRRVLLLAQTRTGRFGTGSSLRALCELTDSEEVASIVGRCRDEAGDSLAGKFRSMLQQFEATDEELGEIDGEPLRLVEFSGDGDRVELWDTGAGAEAGDVWDEVDPYAQRGVG